MTPFFEIVYTLLKFLGQLLGQSRLLSKTLGCIDPDFERLGEIWVITIRFLENTCD